MFKDNKYTKWYDAIISRAMVRDREIIGQIEWHHRIPSSLGGKNEHKVALTPREHFICHRLLVKMLDGEDKKKMSWALHLMLYSENPYQNRYRPTSKTYEYFREQFYGSLRGKKREITQEHRAKIAEANRRRLKGKTLPQEWRAKMSASRTGERNGMFGKKHTAEAIIKMKSGQSKGGKAHKGKKLSIETRQKIAASVSAHQKANPRVVSEETRRKISDARKRYWSEKKAINSVT